MGCVAKIGSFPNARNKSRPLTLKASTYAVDAIFDNSPGPIDLVVDTLDQTVINQKTTNGNTIVNFPDAQLSYLTFRNNSPTQPVFYGYVLNGESDFGIDLRVTGMILKAGDSVDIEAPACSLIVVSGATDNSDINCRIDRGQAQ